MLAELCKRGVGPSSRCFPHLARREMFFCCVPVREPPPGREASSNSKRGEMHAIRIIWQHPAQVRKRGTKCKTTLFTTTA